MRIILDEIISWQFLVGILVLALFIIWYYFGGKKEVKFVGFKPLLFGKDINGNSMEVEEKEEKEGNEVVVEEVEEEIDFSHDSVIELSYLAESEEVEPEESQTPIETEGDINFKDNFKDKEEAEKKLALGCHSCYKNGKLSKGEELCKQVVEDMFGKKFYCIRPNFLKNPETGRNLELDLYNDSLKLAIEYNGAQHYVYPSAFLKNEQDLLNQIRKDEYKRQMCDENGIYLITVPYTVPLKYKDISEYIKYHLNV